MENTRSRVRCIRSMCRSFWPLILKQTVILTAISNYFLSYTQIIGRWPMPNGNPALSTFISQKICTSISCFRTTKTTSLKGQVGKKINVKHWCCHEGYILYLKSDTKRPEDSTDIEWYLILIFNFMYMQFQLNQLKDVWFIFTIVVCRRTYLCYLCLFVYSGVKYTWETGNSYPSLTHGLTLGFWWGLCCSSF